MATSQPLGYAINAVVEGLTALGIAFYHSWSLTLIILAAIPVLALAISFTATPLQSAITAQDREMTLALKTVSNITENNVLIKCFNAQEHENASYARSVRQAAVYRLRQACYGALQIGLTKFATTAMVVAGFFYGTNMIHMGRTDAGKIVTTFWSCLTATKAFGDILSQKLLLEKGIAAAIALRSVLDHVHKGQVILKSVGGTTLPTLEGDVEVRDISFAYPSSPDQIVLHPSTFFFPVGETTFIVGRSGSGKSTLGSLLMGFYQPVTGSISIDGVDVKNMNINWLRNNVTLVQQQSILFNETVFRNIAFGGRDCSKVTLDQIRQCLDFADLRQTVSGLSNGVDTEVGGRGSSLSGGQKQRMAIARAYLRNPSILILDEFTSALDYKSKAVIIENLQRWRKGKTTIIITHDVLQIRKQDYVYVLRDGHIIADGYRHTLSQENLHPIDDAITGRITLQYDDTLEHRLAAMEESRSLAPPPFRRPQRLSVIHAFSMRATILGPPNDLAWKNNAASRSQIPFTSSVDSNMKILTSNIRSSRILRFRPKGSLPYITLSSLDPTMSDLRVPDQTPTQVPPNNKTQTVDATNKQPICIRDDSDSAVLPVQNNSQQLSILGVLSTAWPELSSHQRFLLCLGVMALLVVAACPPVFASVLMKLFSTFYMAYDWQTKARNYSLGIVGIAVSDGVSCFFMHYLLEVVGQAWVDSLRMKAIDQIIKQPKAWFENSTNSPQIIRSCLDQNAEEMRNLLARFAAAILVVVVMLTLSLIWSLTICWKLTLIGIGAGPLLLVITKTFSLVSSKWEEKTADKIERIGDVFVETFSDIRTIRALTLEYYFHKKYDVAMTKALSVGMRRSVYSGILYGLSDSAIVFVTAGIFRYGTALAVSGDFPIQSILSVFSLLLFSTSSANVAVSLVPQISSSVDAAKRLLRLVHLRAESHESFGQVQIKRSSPQTFSNCIEVRNLTFYYPSRPEVPALSKVTFTIPQNRCTAIVGSSGSGKSTVASLLLGLYPLISNEPKISSSIAIQTPPLVIFGYDFRTLHLPTLRSLVSLVPQTPTLIPGTIRQNILYGELSAALATDQNLKSSAKAAGIHDFIIALPQGYDTIVGDGGQPVSGGQAQRIVIARALAHQPRILILDEATSALDAESAKIIKSSIIRLVRDGRRGIGKGLTVIVITHAKEMMEWADHVVVLKGGKSIEEGGYEELLRRKGELWHMLQ